MGSAAMDVHGEAQVALGHAQVPDDRPRRPAPGEVGEDASARELVPPRPMPSKRSSKLP